MMAGKYTPLENYLLNLPARQNEITLDFDQIEEILNSNLPPQPTKTEDGGCARKRATTSVGAPGPMRAGRSRVWM